MFVIAYAELTSMMEYSLSRDSHFKALHEILQQSSVQPQAVSLAIDLLKVLGKAEENLGTATNQPVVHLARTCMADINMACVPSGSHSRTLADAWFALPARIRHCDCTRAEQSKQALIASDSSVRRDGCQ